MIAYLKTLAANTGLQHTHTVHAATLKARSAVVGIS